MSIHRVGEHRTRAARVVFGFVALLVIATGVTASAQTADLVINAQASPVMPGGTATADVTVSGSLDVSGLSFGVIHDPAILSIGAGDVAVGAPLAATNTGLGPDFLSIDFFANGFTFAAVINTDAAGAELLAATVHQVATMNYAVALSATFGSTSLVFSDTLGTPPVALSVGMGTAFAETVGVDLTVTNGTVFTSIPFMRGDVNENGQVTISDVIYVLTQLFAGVPLTCEDAADADGNESLTLSDPIYVLLYLFDGGPALPEPANACGAPPTPSALGCASFVCP